MKQYIAALLSAFLLFTACAQQEAPIHMGLDVTVESIDAEKQQLTVRSSSNSVKELGERVILDCSDAIREYEIIYVDYGSSKGPRAIDFSDLQIGDQLILSVSEEELAQGDDLIVVEQIQLSTQREGLID